MSEADRNTVVMITLDRLGDLLADAAGRGLIVGTEGTAGDSTDVGIAYHVLNDAGIVPVVNKTGISVIDLL